MRGRRRMKGVECTQLAWQQKKEQNVLRCSEIFQSNLGYVHIFPRSDLPLVPIARVYVWLTISQKESFISNCPEAPRIRVKHPHSHSATKCHRCFVPFSEREQYNLKLVFVPGHRSLRPSRVLQHQDLQRHRREEETETDGDKASV